MRWVVICFVMWALGWKWLLIPFVTWAFVVRWFLTPFVMWPLWCEVVSQPVCDVGPVV